MQSNRGRDTQPELAIRRLVHSAGLRYRVDTRPLSGLNRRADLVFTRARVAVFIDGCYWHGCPAHGTWPSTNAAYWSSKIIANRRRDEETNAVLEAEGWVVLRFWEHEEPTDAASAIARTVLPRSPKRRTDTQ